MKIKYIEPKTLIEVETTLLEILNWDDDNWDREDISYKTDSMDIEIQFLGGHKAVYIWIEKLDSRLKFDTVNLSPETINKVIESAMKTLGVEYE